MGSGVRQRRRAKCAYGFLSGLRRGLRVPCSRKCRCPREAQRKLPGRRRRRFGGRASKLPPAKPGIRITVPGTPPHIAVAHAAVLRKARPCAIAAQTVRAPRSSRRAGQCSRRTARRGSRTLRRRRHNRRVGPGALQMRGCGSSSRQSFPRKRCSWHPREARRAPRERESTRRVTRNLQCVRARLGDARRARGLFGAMETQWAQSRSPSRSGAVELQSGGQRGKVVPPPTEVAEIGGPCRSRP